MMRRLICILLLALGSCFLYDPFTVTETRQVRPERLPDGTCVLSEVRLPDTLPEEVRLLGPDRTPLLTVRRPSIAAKNGSLYLTGVAAPLPERCTVCAVTPRTVGRGTFGSLVLLVLLAVWGLEAGWNARHPSVRPQSSLARHRREGSFDLRMHYFRAFAISMIALGHYFWQVQPTLELTVFRSDSVYFLFISGYLCQFLFDRRPDTPWAYYKKKILHVALPYVFCSLMTLLLVRLFNYAACWEVWEDPSFALLNLLKALVAGGAQGPYWYMPFVGLFFLASPLLVRLQNKTLCAVLFASVVIACIFPSRDSVSGAPLLSRVRWYCYFAYAYLFGIAYARHTALFDRFLHAVRWVAPALGLLIALLLLFPNHPLVDTLGNHERYFLHNIQKLCFTLWILTALRGLGTVRLPVADLLARYSFVIFFLHSLFITPAERAAAALCAAVGGSPLADGCLQGLVGLLYLAVVLAVCITVRTALGRSSRYLVGY